MCRIAVVFNTRGLPLAKGFAQLEESMGGHGNGVASLSQGGEWTLTKGVKMNTDACDAAARRGVCAIFHTRAASQGSVTDGNTQPFIAGGRVLCHNGHIGHKVDAIANLMGIPFVPDWSDSRVLSEVIAQGKGLAACAEFLEGFDGNAFVIAEGSRVGIVAAKPFAALWRKGTCHALASEKVESWQGTWKLFTGIVWFDSDKRTVDFSDSVDETPTPEAKKTKAKLWGDDLMNSINW
jgi:glutamine phosphoribosylpyrophosphate amidotransferase